MRKICLFLFCMMFTVTSCTYITYESACECKGKGEGEGEDECQMNSSEVAIARFQHYFCDSNGNMAIHPLDEYSHIWAVGTTSGERACEIFSDITGLCVTAKESYTYCYQSEDGSVELRITGNLIADENAVYATIYVTIPGYEDIDQIKIVTPEYLRQNNADTVVPVII